MRVAIILGSTRDGRLGERVAKWVLSQAREMDGWEVELVDLREINLPLYHDETQPPDMAGNYLDPAVGAWSRRIAQAEAFIFVTAEYNHGLPAPLKNAIDWLYPEWANKAAGIVSYSNGYGGGIRATEMLRLVLATVGIATTQTATNVARAQDNFTPAGVATTDHFAGMLARMLGQLDKWGRALAATRT